MFDLNYILNEITTLNDDYAFVDNKPIDIRRKKYKLWRKLFNTGQLKCKCCGCKATEIRLIKCWGAGSIYKKNGNIKHTFKLFNESGEEMTIDHWVPRSFLKKLKMNWKIEHNLVLMCRACNKFKADMIPLYWKECMKK